MPLKPYTTDAKVAAFLGIADFEDGQFDDAIDAAADVIENVTGRTFASGDEATVRYYPASGDYVNTGDITEITEVAFGPEQGPFVALAPSNWYGLPLRGEESTDPFTRIRTSGGYGSTVRVTGRFGYADAPPKAIEYAATVIAAGIYNSSSASSSVSVGGTGAVKSESIGSYSVTYADPSSASVVSGGWDAFAGVKPILDQYKVYPL